MGSREWIQKQEIVRLGSECMTCILKKELEKFPDVSPAGAA